MSRSLLPFFCLALTSTALAQTTSFSYTGTNLSFVPQNTTYSTYFSVAGTGNVTGLGQAQIRITGASVRERGLGCGNQIQADITFTVGANDSITLTIFGTSNDFGRALPAVITGSSGAYQGRGGSGTATLTLISTSAVNLSVTGTLTAAGVSKPASIAPSGVVPFFSRVPIVQPGSWISIYGSNLANATAVWDGRFVTELGGVSVNIGGKAAYLSVVSASQLNVQVPDIGTVGCSNIIVTTPNGTAQSTVTLSASSPSFSLLDSKYVAATISTPDGSGAYGSGINSYDISGPVNGFAYKTRPAKAGEIIALYGVGFGPTAQAVTAGAYAAYPVNTFERPVITIGGVTADWVFSGLVAPGLYQVNVRIPAGLKAGDQQLRATVPTQGNTLLFSSFKTQSCDDPDPQGTVPVNCNVYVAVQ